MDTNDDSEPLLVDDGGDDDEGGAPPSLLCPITQEVMVEPVIASDGFTYERSAIERWLDMGADRRSPTTNARCRARRRANRHLASMIAAYRSRLGARVVALAGARVSAPDGSPEALNIIEALIEREADRRAGRSRRKHLGKLLEDPDSDAGDVADDERRAARRRDADARRATDEEARDSQGALRRLADRPGDAAAAVPAGVFGAARLRQRGYFPSLFALQFGLVPDRRRGPGRFKWTCFAFLEEPAVQSATHRERVAMRRMRAGILSVGTLLFFFLCFG
ncbi:ubiquitin-protein transferase [Aureococcus anophagefferens]|nr:ubiquitin-protein transferase [Aureococcus anophagefferens]